MTESRPSIPEPIKRLVRQQCFFGCAICGMPFFQYDHIEEYAEVQEHTADNLVLLCPNHHSAKTTNKLSKERIRQAKKNPFNANREHTSGFKVEPSKQLLAMLGTNSVVGWYPDGNGEHYPVWINGKGFFIIHSDEGWLSISIAITDQDGNVILSVKRGELIVSTSTWDYLYESDNVQIREGLGDIILDLIFSDVKVEVLKGMFFDKTKDGFVVENGALLTFFNGENKGCITGGQSHANGCGGWGILNTQSFPDVKVPGGFGVLMCS
ncbi:HNH endonuclease signature motif containing protein [Klebsiella michiganensis]|uniref:HNH endonuclease signature motif containing protein n=1 Tax=Klebsiella michiganensis TaxID=1134687 RepID=UPI001CD02DFA|nr:HNH endonuclease signature motif containing protein [Klebsiella michiganensis]MBZ7507808.1 HNH endonuclease [Klebsiella michiganensis]